jgi:2-methylcitrate dehydratase PrpD
VTDYLDSLARFAAETRFEDIPAEAIEATKLILLDTLGGMLASSTLPEVGRFAALAASRPGPSTLVGLGHTADPLFAAMVNSTSACSYETDEGNRLGVAIRRFTSCRRRWRLPKQGTRAGAGCWRRLRWPTR